MSELKVEGFELSLVSVDAYDPQSFIDGAKWQAARQSPAPIPEQVAQEVTQQAAKAETAEQAFNSLYSAVMNIPCERTMSHFVTQADMRLYKDGHRDARHAAVDLIAEFASRFRAQGGNTNTESSGLAPTTSTVSASSSAPTELRNAFITLESNGGEGRAIVLKFNNRNDAYTVHNFLLKGGAA